MKKKFLSCVVLTCVITTFFSFRSAKIPEKSFPYLSPGAVVVDEAEEIAYTALTTGRAIAVTRLKQKMTVDRIGLKQNPNNLLLSSDGTRLFVSCGEADGRVDIFQLPRKKRIASVRVGHTPIGMALSADGKKLYVANRFNNNISVVDVGKKKEIQTIPVVREPKAVSLSPDGNVLAVAGYLPEQPANGDWIASRISLIDTRSNAVKNVTLNNGSQSVEGIAFSADGRYLYAVHTLSQYNALITQVERGWVNTSALSIIDVKNHSVYAAVLLDDINKGAANPAGICLDGRQLYITIAGGHELMAVDLESLHAKLESLFSSPQREGIKNKTELLTSFTFMAGLKRRIPVEGRSPRSVACCYGKPVVSSRFSTNLEVLSLNDEEPGGTISLGEEPEADAVRRGEAAFCDATLCFQGWQSCLSCHPDGRADGLNWDQMNDGSGNPKNTKSLLYSHVTPPSMITAIRANAELAVRKGIIHTLVTEQPESVASDMDEYLKAMKPVESPYLAEYKKKDPKQRGKALFESTGCIDCHSGKYHTDQKSYDVGSGENEYENVPFDTPSLSEVWRTAPYLYNGRAVTLEEVFTEYNKKGLHGATQNLSEEELAALILYVKTL